MLRDLQFMYLIMTTAFLNEALCVLMYMCRRDKPSAYASLRHLLLFERNELQRIVLTEM